MRYLTKNLLELCSKHNRHKELRDSWFNTSTTFHGFLSLLVRHFWRFYFVDWLDSVYRLRPLWDDLSGIDSNDISQLNNMKHNVSVFRRWKVSVYSSKRIYVLWFFIYIYIIFDTCHDTVSSSLPKISYLVSTDWKNRRIRSKGSLFVTVDINYVTCPQVIHFDQDGMVTEGLDSFFTTETRT